MEGQQQKIQPEGSSLFQGSSTCKMTDKGFHWKLENLAKDFTATITQWRKQANEIQVLQSDSKNTQEIRNGRNMLMDIMNRLEATYSTIDAHLTDSNEKAADGTRTLEVFQGKYKGIANDHHTLLRNITSCLRDLEFDFASRNFSRTSRSHSSRTSRSSHLSRTLRESTEAMVEGAALKAKLKYVDVKAKHKAGLERIRTQRQINIAQAKLDVLESTQDSNLNMAELPSEVDTDRQVKEFLGAQPDMTKPLSGHTDDPSTAVADLLVVKSTSCMAGHTTKKIEIGQDPVISHLNPDTPHFVPHQQIPSMAAVGDRYIRTQSDIYHNPHGPCQPNAVASPVLSVSCNMVPRNDLYLEQAQVDEERNPEKALVGLARCLAEQVSLSRLPPPEPSIFYRDPMRYPDWKAVFQTLIEHWQIPAVERIHYLKKYLGGQVKDAVEGYYLLPPEDAFDEAKKLLEGHYSNPFVVANAFRDKLEK